MNATVEIFAIGDELLRGIVAESNSHWIAKRIAARGARLERVTVLPDDVEVVAGEMRAALERAPAMIVTHGGLGPTHDDLTREMIAQATGLPLEMDAAASAIVRRRYEELARSGSVADPSPTEDRMRMALLPRGARALDNHVGTAPAFTLAIASSTIVALPGVPPELQWIWDGPLSPVLDELLGPGAFAEETFETDLLDESRIAWLVKMLQDEHPEVYVKSRARGFEEGEEVRITLAASARSTVEATERVARAASDLRAALAAEGIVTRAP